MKVLQEICVTQETVNDEYVTVVKLHFNNDDFVKSGESVIDVETSKAILSIEAEKNGYIRYYCNEGDDIEVGNLIVGIYDSVADESVLASRENSLLSNTSSPQHVTTETRDKTAETRSEYTEEATLNAEDKPEPEFSKSALEYIHKANLDKRLFAGMDLVTYTDVLNIAEIKTESGTAEREPSDESTGMKGMLAEASFFQLQKEADNIAMLDSESKILRYRALGAFIGKNVVIGRGSVIISKQILIDEGVIIEDNCVIRSESVHLGELGLYRTGFDCTCKRIRIGKEAFVARNVIIGRGGCGEPTANLKLGDRVFIGEKCLLNTCMPISVGDECFIGQNSSIMTHNIGLSYLEGYENAFAPVRIGNRVQIGINCVLYPNSEIGNGSIVASNSYVIGRIPDEKLAMGIPAKVVKDSHRKITIEERRRRFSQLIKRFITLLEVRKISISKKIISSDTLISFNYEGIDETVLFCEHLFINKLSLMSHPLTIVTLEGGEYESQEDKVIFDLKKLEVHGKPTPVTEGLREFFCKAGIRLSPWPWRYKGGLL